MFIAYYINKRSTMAQWLMTRLAIVGTWVRFPGPPKLNIILSNKFLCRLVNVLHHTPHQSTCHMSTISHPKAMRGGVPCPSVKAHAGNCKSQTWLSLVGQKTAINTSKKGPNPPWFCYFFYFSFPYNFFF